MLYRCSSVYTGVEICVHWTFRSVFPRRSGLCFDGLKPRLSGEAGSRRALIPLISREWATSGTLKAKCLFITVTPLSPAEYHPSGPFRLDKEGGTQSHNSVLAVPEEPIYSL